jgi:iron complex outermembrane receptor protein
MKPKTPKSAPSAPARCRAARSIAATGCALLSAAILSAQSSPDTPNGSNLGDLSIEQLMNEPVTSVAKKETDLFQSPAAVAVVTADDISRMDFTSLPEALRFVPGVDVARINGTDWAVSVRGSNSQFADGTLVLIDGRSIYTSSFGGVYWRTQGLYMGDIEQIEVIRGPGSTLWGANALNGVINVITKNAKETQGLVATVNEGSEDDPSVTLQYGGKAGDFVYYRAYLNYFSRSGLEDPVGADSGQFSRGWNGGFRLDATPSPDDSLTLEGNYYDLHVGESVSDPSLNLAAPQFVNVIGGDMGESLLGKWEKRISDNSEWSLQSFYDHYRNDNGLSQEFSDTYDLEFQDRFPIGDNQDVVAGLGYRFVRDFLPPSDVAIWTPELNLTHLYSAFVQDQVSLVRDRLSMIPGVKLEHNDVTGLEFEPGARLLFTPSTTQTIWLSVTRAVRTPTLVETSGRFVGATFPTTPGGPPAEVVVAGGPDIDGSEKVIAYEVGYRIQLTSELSFDVATFYNVYDDLIFDGPVSSQFAFSPAPPHLLLLSNTEAGGTGRSYGVEPSVQWRLSPRWRLVADYSLLRSRYDPVASESENSPRYQAHLRSYLDLPHGIELNGALAYVSSIVDTVTTAPQPVPSYVRFDLGLVWRPSRTFEIGVWGQNIGDPRHLEFANESSPSLIEVPEEFSTRLTIRY